MREVAQVCGRCGRRFFVQVDAWSDRPDLTGLGYCGCSRSAGGFAPLFFFAFIFVGLVVGVAQAATAG